MRKAYRKGALGAMMDEYERAASELRRLVEQIPEDEFVRVVDPQTSDENCRSVQTIMSHVVSAGGTAMPIISGSPSPSPQPALRSDSFRVRSQWRSLRPCSNTQLKR